MSDSTSTNNESNTNKIGEDIPYQEKKQNSQENINKNEDPKVSNDNRIEKNKISRSQIDEEILENLIEYYKLEEEKDKNYIAYSKSENILDNKEGSNKKGKEMSAEELISKKRETIINCIQNQKRYGTLNLNEPKTLDLGEIYKNMSIEQISANLKQEKVEEIRKLVENEKEEDEIKKEKKEKEEEIENNENKIIEEEKEEELEEKNLVNNIIENEEDIIENNNNNYINENSIENQKSPNSKKKLLIEKINISEKEKEEERDTFCESFYLVSFSKENGQISKDSEIFLADCKHKECSKLPSMKAEIIYKYPEKDKKNSEIRNANAYICFPTGIKLCYEQNEEKIKTVTNYITTLTNQAGDTIFAVYYHFFLKMNHKEFRNNYKIFPLRYQLLEYQNKISMLNKQKEEIEAETKKLSYYSILMNKPNVYIPFCLCLVSKYPFYKQIEICLESILLSFQNNIAPEKLYNLVLYLVKSIPLPPLHTQISFTLPYTVIPCQIQYPYLEEKLEYGDDPIILLKKLSVENIFCIFTFLYY